MPKMLSAACGGQGWGGWGEHSGSETPSLTSAEQSTATCQCLSTPPHQICRYLLPENIIMQNSRGRIQGMLQECTLGCPLRLFPKWLSANNILGMTLGKTTHS